MNEPVSSKMRNNVNHPSVLVYVLVKVITCIWCTWFVDVHTINRDLLVTCWLVRFPICVKNCCRRKLWLQYDLTVRWYFHSFASIWPYDNVNWKPFVDYYLVETAVVLYAVFKGLCCVAIWYNCRIWLTFCVPACLRNAVCAGVVLLIPHSLQLQKVNLLSLCLYKTGLKSFGLAVALKKWAVAQQFLCDCVFTTNPAPFDNL